MNHLTEEGLEQAITDAQKSDEMGLVRRLYYIRNLYQGDTREEHPKCEISPTIFEDKDHFGEFVTETFLKPSHRLSFTVDWIDTFLPDVQKLC